MPPAWKLTYDVQARGARGLDTTTRLMGTRRSDWFEIDTFPDDDSPIVARPSVTTAQPYLADAEPDCLRKAIDLCQILAVANGNWVVFEPAGAPQIQELEGAKQPSGGAGLGLSGSLTGISKHGIENDRYNLDAAARLRDDADLRADLDTWRLANTEDDAPTRLIHYFRIYEREATAVMNAEPQLLTSEEIDAAADAALAALPARLGPDERTRIGQTIKSALPRVRNRSRPAVLAERLSELLSTGSQEPVVVTPKEVSEMDQARGRYAHRGAERDAQPAPQAQERLRQSALALLRRALSI